jgi:hypothetical protein
MESLKSIMTQEFVRIRRSPECWQASVRVVLKILRTAGMLVQGWTVTECLRDIYLQPLYDHGNMLWVAEDQGEVDPSPSKKGSTSYEEQKRKAAQWAADSLKGPSGKKERAKVRARCVRFTSLHVLSLRLTFPTLSYLPYSSMQYHTLPSLTSPHSLNCTNLYLALSHITLPYLTQTLLSLNDVILFE